jgi:pimeloyl-ACP methyl ester carboxylesterase
MNTLTTRRSTLRGLLQLGAGAALLPLVRTNGAFGGVASQCPGADLRIDWVPDVMHPVGHAFRDYDVADGAPGAVRVWFPTGEEFAPGPRVAKFLQHCTARWPVVLFLHGEQPCGTPTDPDYYKRWDTIPAELARSGYVVLVPRHEQRLPVDTSDAPFVASFIDWARNVWEFAGALDQRPDAVAVAGHSWGALLMARVAQIRTDISAFVSLSGGWTELAENPVN